MSEMDISSAVSSNLTNAITDYSVNPVSIDSVNSDETTYFNSNFSKWLGYYKKIPELKQAIDAAATWTIGQGYKADELTTLTLMRIKGNGKDTFNSILKNMIIVSHIGGDSFAEIIRDEDGKLVNLKPLNAGTMKIVYNKKGLIKRFEQTGGSEIVKFKPSEIFYIPHNRIADEIHGCSMVESVEDIILMRNEAMADYKQLMHRHVRPLVKFILDTDDTTKINAFKAKADAVVASGENLYIPKGTVEHEIISIPANATLSPLSWIEQLNKYFFQAAGVPMIVVGGSGEFTEATAKIAYLAFEQTTSDRQLFIEEQVLNQLNLEIHLEFPTSLANDVLSDKQKDGNAMAQPSDTTQTPMQQPNTDMTNMGVKQNG